MKTKLFLVGLFMAVSAATLFAQKNESRSLLVNADYAAFRLADDSVNSYVEIHYNLRRSQLKYEPLQKGYEAMINFKLKLKDNTGKLIDSLSWKGANQIEKLSELDDRGYMISDIMADRLPPGQYQIELIVENGEKHGSTSFEMNVPNFKGKAPEISTLELAYQIKPDSVGKFVKNGMLVMPNPSGQFLPENGKINIYAEGYGLDTLSSADSVFYITLEVLAPAGQLVRSFKPISYRKPGESAVIVADLPLDSLESGNYKLKMILTDGNSSAVAFRPFSVNLKRESARKAMMQGILRYFPEASELKTDEDAKKFRDEITYIATSDELKMYDSLNLTGKAAFQRDFWSRRNPNPGSAQNDFEIEHYRRFKYVADTFGRFQGGNAGWRTDRGRVYILYGEPTDVERSPQSYGDRAWEKWNYNSLEGGVYFIFVDMENSSDYTLVHSSKSGEPKDYEWEQKIKVGAMAR